jgi:integrase
VQRDLIPFNPAHGVEAPRHRSRKVEAWSREEARTFIRAAAQAPRENGDVFLVQLGTGLRPSETLAIHVEDLDLDRARVRIHHGLAWRKGGKWVIKETKGKDDVWLNLPAFSVEAIRRQLERRAEWAKWDGWQEHGLLFTTPAGLPLRVTSVGRQLTRLCKQTGVPRVTPHGIRHQTASALLAAGRTLTDVQYFLRHRTQRTTSDIYGHMADDARAAVSSVLDELSPDK